MLDEGCAVILGSVLILIAIFAAVYFLCSVADYSVTPQSYEFRYENGDEKEHFQHLQWQLRQIEDKIDKIEGK